MKTNFFHHYWEIFFASGEGLMQIMPFNQTIPKANYQRLQSHQTDIEALRGDFEKVGEYLNLAFSDFEEENRTKNIIPIKY